MIELLFLSIRLSLRGKFENFMAYHINVSIAFLFFNVSGYHICFLNNCEILVQFVDLLIKNNYLNKVV